MENILFLAQMLVMFFMILFVVAGSLPFLAKALNEEDYIVNASYYFSAAFFIPLFVVILTLCSWMSYAF